MLKLALGLTPAAIVLACAIVFLGVVGGFAAECAGQAVTASFYGLETCRPGKKCQTANGEHFDGTSLTAAHRTLPFGTKLRVTYRGKSVVVRLNDRGPFIEDRALDLSRAAAARIGMIEAGVARVCMERL